MLISKFDLYRNEWLDLVFDDRNKSYGAYDLRLHYAKTMTKAMGITFLSLAVVCGAVYFVNSQREIVHHTIVDVTPPVTPPVQPPVKKIEKQPAPAHSKPLPVKQVETIANPPVVVAPDNVAKDPVKNDDLQGKAVGPVTLHGTGGDNIDVPNPGPGTTPAVDVSVHTIDGLDVMPEPVGGAGAWAKFLNKNLRFPAPAQEEGVSGRVLLSFIIEKDGTLSNITVDRPAGHGFDEEALRVLKLAKAWNPGKQNGQPVRVKYSIPINFQLAE